MNRYRKLDMTVGEKEMVIAELQAKYVGECWRKFFFPVFDACVMWVNIGLLYPARSSVNGLETCAIFSITRMQLKNHLRLRHFRFSAPQVVFIFAFRFQIVNEVFWSISLSKQSGIVLEQNFSLFVNRLIEAQETTREIRKLNQIMKTKDARIENLETK